MLSEIGMFKSIFASIKRIMLVRNATFKPISDVIRWMYKKRFVFELEEKIVDKIERVGGEKLWGISGRNAFLLLYSFVRATKPQVVIETGVASGSSSYVILQALEKNKKGVLYSIDFPETWQFDAEGRKSGWLVPDSLRRRWKLLIGRSSDLLPDLLAQLKKIDIFFHDSEHTYENMWFEYNLVWNYIKKDGLLLSHDVTWNSAFFDFCKQKGLKPIVLGGNIGFIRKR